MILYMNMDIVVIIYLLKKYKVRKGEKMKNFVYVIKKETVRRYYGGCNVKGNIYRIKNNKPEFIAEFDYCTSSYKGEESEILTAIAEKTKQLTKKEKSFFQGLYYSWSDAIEANIKISRL